MTRIELSDDQQEVLKTALQQVADGEPIILTAKGVELAAMVPIGDVNPQQDETAATEQAPTLADFLHGHVGVLHSSEYVPGGARLSEDSRRQFAEGLATQHYDQQR